MEITPSKTERKEHAKLFGEIAAIVYACETINDYKEAAKAINKSQKVFFAYCYMNAFVVYKGNKANHGTSGVLHVTFIK